MGVGENLYQIVGLADTRISRHEVGGEDLLEDVGQPGGVEAHIAATHRQVALHTVCLVVEGSDEDHVAVHLPLRRTDDLLPDVLRRNTIPSQGFFCE